MVTYMNRIILPVDGLTEINKIAEKALSLAKDMERNVVALYVVDTPRLTDVIPPNETTVAWESILAVEAQRILKEIEKKGKKLGVYVEKKVVKGIPEIEILKEAKKHDLIVMGCKSKVIFERFLTKNVCEQVLEHSSSSIMTYQIK